MGHDTLKFVRIDRENIWQLERLIAHAGDSTKTFRYFDKRDVSIVLDHIYSCIAFKGDRSIGYGHLEQEGGVVWLGIMISSSEVGKGFGKQMMDHLMFRARDMRLMKVRLSVDKINQAAIRLYRKFNFMVIEEREDIIMMEVDLEKFYQ